MNWILGILGMICLAIGASLNIKQTNLVKTTISSMFLITGGILIWEGLIRMQTFT